MATNTEAKPRETVRVQTAGGDIIIDVWGTQAFWEGVEDSPDCEGVPELLAWLRKLINGGCLVETGFDGCGGLCLITPSAVLAMTHTYASNQ